MSLYSVMHSSVSGLSAQSIAMAAISDNITNVNTVGFKGSSVQFSSMVTQQVSERTAAAGGVQPTIRGGMDMQGLLSPSSVTTDIAVAGDGFFVINESPNPELGDQWAYTRAGSFRVDEQGYLVNTGGWYLQAWPTLPDGTVGYYDNTGTRQDINKTQIDKENLRPVNLNMISGTAAATTRMEVKLNLPAEAGVDPDEPYRSDALFYDSLGNSQDLGMEWFKTGVNTWNVELVPPQDAAVVTTTRDDNTSPTGEVVTFARGQLVFEGTWTDGVLGELDGATFQVTGLNGNSHTFTFDDGTDLNTSGVANWSASGNNYTIGIRGADSWAEIAEEVARVVAGDQDGNALTQDPDSRIYAKGNRVYLDTDSTNGDIDVTFTSDPNNGLAKYMPTYGIGDFRVPQIDVVEATIEFTGDGTPEAINVDRINIEFANGAKNMTGDDAMSIFLGTRGLADGVTQFSGGFQPISVHHNGARFGAISGVSIGEDGIITALFDNGESRALYKIPLATFINPNGLESRSGNAWVQSDNAGPVTLRDPGSTGAGKVQSNALEASTVDIGEEFTNMIITQRAYSAAAKIVTTADQMLDEIIRLKR